MSDGLFCNEGMAGRVQRIEQTTSAGSRYGKGSPLHKSDSLQHLIHQTQLEGFRGAEDIIGLVYGSCSCMADSSNERMRKGSNRTDTSW
eukprot:CAMPEP_0205861286 /NCGR_PEP_ID=MMETSP1083-20121108/5689_1 /ASSEMBLY_ACC=CAM_ASM_000430 /TAXON_ID=97485 /ORGANISM="Prymnesium parvum, Strain Texoma1" /LENGTH=88 /DNA_ID=CAMNT_0053222981 /DNA_START=329 /DNA_END=595 /DNA_ORIENTATION=-